MKQHLLVLALTALCFESTLGEGFEYTIFDGIVGTQSSWFQANRWTNVMIVPGPEDTVAIDNDNAYIAIDDTTVTAKCMDLTIGKTTGPMESVQLDLLLNTELQVMNDLTIGVADGSDGTIYAQDGAKVIVNGLVTIGAAGNGILILKGSSMLAANDLSIRTGAASGCKIVLDKNAKIELEGDKQDAMDALIEGGYIIPSDSSVVLEAGFDGTKTVVAKFVPSEAPTGIPTATPTVTPGNPTASPVSPPDDDCTNKKLKFKNKKKKNCKWVGKNTQKRCKKKWKNDEGVKVKLSEFCPLQCKKECAPCPDDETFAYKDDPNKNCDWVGKVQTKKKCKYDWQGRKISDFCPATCGTCPSEGSNSNVIIS